MTSRTRRVSCTTSTGRTSSTRTASRSSNTCLSSRNGGPTNIAFAPSFATSWCRSRSTGRPSMRCSASTSRPTRTRPTISPRARSRSTNIVTSEDVVINAVGRELYELFFQGYTRKQWGLDPSELDKSGDGAHPNADQHRRPLFHRYVPGDAARWLYCDVQADARQPADRRPHRRRLPGLQGPCRRDRRSHHLYRARSTNISIIASASCPTAA